MRMYEVNKYFIKVTFLLLMFVVINVEVSAARFFKYMDKEGKLVVSSTLPPEVSQDGYEIVNEMGVILETVSARKTKAQLAEEVANKEKTDLEALRAREQQQLDSILINSYTDISDIERARDNEITAKDRDVMLLKQNVRRLTRLLEDTQTRAARDERLGREVSKKILDEVVQFKGRIEAENNEVLKTEEHKSRINQRYSSSMIRFSELKAAELLRNYKPGDNSVRDSRAIIYQCTATSQCDTAWQASLRYASEFSTTDLSWANETTIMMGKPRKNDDISLMLTRVNTSSGEESSIVLEVRCSKSNKGQEFCLSEKVSSIEKGFLPYLK